jgi:hypothetical protein
MPSLPKSLTDAIAAADVPLVAIFTEVIDPMPSIPRMTWEFDSGRIRVRLNQAMKELVAATAA